MIQRKYAGVSALQRSNAANISNNPTKGLDKQEEVQCNSNYVVITRRVISFRTILHATLTLNICINFPLGFAGVAGFAQNRAKASHLFALRGHLLS